MHQKLTRGIPLVERSVTGHFKTASQGRIKPATPRRLIHISFLMQARLFKFLPSAGVARRIDLMPPRALSLREPQIPECAQEPFAGTQQAR